MTQSSESHNLYAFKLDFCYFSRDRKSTALTTMICTPGQTIPPQVSLETIYIGDFIFVVGIYQY